MPTTSDPKAKRMETTPMATPLALSSLSPFGSDVPKFSSPGAVVCGSGSAHARYCFGARIVMNSVGEERKGKSKLTMIIQYRNPLQSDKKSQDYRGVGDIEANWKERRRQQMRAEL